MVNTERTSEPRDRIAEMHRRHRRDDVVLTLVVATAAVIGIGGVTALNLIFG